MLILRTAPSLHFALKTAAALTMTAYLTQISVRHFASLRHHHLVSLLSRHPTSRPATQQVHSYVVTSGLLCHPTPSCMQLFNGMLRRYSLGDFPQESFLLFKHLQCFPSLHFDSFTYSFLLKACSNLYSRIPGIQVHALVIKVGFEFHVYVQTALLHMYAACGSLVDASKVFGDMPEKNFVTWNVMITAYIKRGEIELARLLFDKMTDRTVVTWTTIIDGYTRTGHPNEAIELFREMVVGDGIHPTEITMLAIFPAISNLGALKICQSVHAYGEKRGFYAYDIRITNSLLDSYAKCGCIGSASRFFEGIPAERKNIVSWTSIISGFAMHGMGKEAVKNFERMEATGFVPNRVTYLSVLIACSHGGLVDEGLKIFEKMVNECRVAPDIKHYGCLIDMLGREGRLEEAEKIALEIPADIVTVVIWRTLLGACSFHGNVEMGERVTRKVLDMERGYGGDYVLMSNIFAGVGRYGDAERLRTLMDDRNAFKVPGLSLV